MDRIGIYRVPSGKLLNLYTRIVERMQELDGYFFKKGDEMGKDYTGMGNDGKYSATKSTAGTTHSRPRKGSRMPASVGKGKESL